MPCGRGAPRIHGELAKLGVKVSERSVLKHLPSRPSSPRGPTWKAFLANHRESLASMDFITVPTWRFQRLNALIILSHGRRNVLHLVVSVRNT